MTDIKTEYSSRLSREKNPYLLQHASNPVDWYPWGKQAFERAKKENKPIFLSIGYSTCHWCHVMERESFEDENVARLLNDHFICIKVDREERPDIDAVYMRACQLLTQRGGWPLTIIMTPDKKPFFAGTYFPKQRRFNQPGLMDILPKIHSLWKDSQNELTSSAQKITAALQASYPVSSPMNLNPEILDQGFHQLSRQFDEHHGGFGQEPKFPASHNLLFLLRYWKRTGNSSSLDMVEKTLQAISLGGIHDHLGRGFHRYSTDAGWRLPHFEKMLYDQALISLAFIETFQATGKERYKKTAEDTLGYVLRDMTSPEGGFYSAEDADSEGKEGLFYLWKDEEIRQILTKEETELAVRIFSLSREGNYIDEATGEKTGLNILHMRKPLQAHAEELGMSLEDLGQMLDVPRNKLFQARKNRPHPFKDDKILTDWNGLMIGALAKAAQAFHNDRYAEAAQQASDFILKKLLRPSGELLHRYRDGHSAVPAYCDDYAFVAWGFLALYEATFEIRFFQAAHNLMEYLLKHFWDEKLGGFHFTADNAEIPLIRQKEFYDGAVPSGNSMASECLLRLSRMTGKSLYEDKADRLFRASSQEALQSPGAFSFLLCALDYAFGPSYEVVISGNLENKDTQKLLEGLRSSYSPNKVVLFNPAKIKDPEIQRLAPFTRNQPMINNRATAYVCQQQTCKKPTHNIHEMLSNLGISHKL